MSSLPYVFNFLTSPESVQPGQIYSSQDFKFLVTKLLPDTPGVVRALILTDFLEAGDEHDVILKNNDQLKEIFPVTKLAWRLSEGPIPVSELKLYCGTLSDESFRSVQSSFRFSRQKPDVVQAHYFEIISDKLQPVRMEAIRVIEESLVPLFYLPSPAVREDHESAFLSSMPAAAAYEPTHDAEIVNFFAAERMADHVTLLQNSSFLLRLSMVEKRIYLVVFCENDIPFRILSVNGIPGTEFNINLKDGRGFLAPGDQLFKSGLNNLKINAGNETIDLVFNIKEKNG